VAVAVVVVTLVVAVATGAADTAVAVSITDTIVISAKVVFFITKTFFQDDLWSPKYVIPLFL
jgi:hypothetical protein